jgi:hypothetical protein
VPMARRAGAYQSGRKSSAPSHLVKGEPVLVRGAAREQHPAKAVGEGFDFHVRILKAFLERDPLHSTSLRCHVPQAFHSGFQAWMSPVAHAL